MEGGEISSLSEVDQTFTSTISGEKRAETGMDVRVEGCAEEPGQQQCHGQGQE